MMRISEETAEIIAKVITGDHLFPPVCRNGGEVASFFEECGVGDKFEGTKWRWAKQMLMNYNGTNVIDKVLESVFKPQKWLRINVSIEDVLSEVNQYLVYDNYSICVEGKGIRIENLGSIAHEAVETIIFGSTGTKPDIIINDTLIGEIEIKGNTGDYLIYGHDKKSKEVTWKHLIEWWMKKYEVSDEDAWEAILGKLRGSCGDGPEKLFFDTYCHHWCEKYGDNALALLPQVWYKYDPKNKKDRKENALYNQRVDFMMILPNGVRVIFEIDGKEHYSKNVDGRAIADSQQYSKLAEYDRDIQLQGHIILRYGGADFVDKEKMKLIIINDFERLFNLYEIE